LCAAFAGDEPDAVAVDDVIDFTGELVNMMCGTWLTGAAAHETFELAPPRVARFAAAPDADPNAGLRLDTTYLAIDEASVRLDVGWYAGEASAFAASSQGERP